MASITPVMCGPCEAEKDSTKASIWCNNCEEGLCSICSDQHKKFKTTRDHKTVDIDAYSKLPMFIRSIKTDCERHGLKLHLYCPNHLCPCCEVCVSSDHSNCVGIKSMTSVVQKENLEESVHYLDYEIKSVLNVYEKIIISINESKEDRHKTQIGIRENTASIRKKINENLDRLETKLNSELSFIVNKEEAHERDVVREIERKKHNITEMQQHMNLLLKHSSKLQSFLGIYHLTQQVHQHQKFLDDKYNDNKIIAANIKLEQNLDFTRLVSSFESLEHLGKVLIVNTEIDLGREKDMHKVAQEKSSKLEGIGNIYLSHDLNDKFTGAIDLGDELSGLICLMDGKVIIVIKEEGRVLILQPDGSLQKCLSVKGLAFGVTQTSKEIIALTYPNEKSVKLVNITDDMIIKVIKLDKKCYGLSYENNSIAIGLSDEEMKQIRVIDLNGISVNSIKVDIKHDIETLVYTDGRVIYTDANKGEVRCIDMTTGCLAWKVGDQVDTKIMNAVCTNKHGIIYALVQSASFPVLEISNDGKESRYLPIKGFSLGNPMLICFSKDNRHAFIHCRDYGYNCLTKFQVLCD